MRSPNSIPLLPTMLGLGLCAAMTLPAFADKTSRANSKSRSSAKNYSQGSFIDMLLVLERQFSEIPFGGTSRNASDIYDATALKWNGIAELYPSEEMTKELPSSTRKPIPKSSLSKSITGKKGSKVLTEVKNGKARFNKSTKPNKVRKP